LRSIFVHLWGTSESEVSAWLGRHYTCGPARWLLERDGNPYLYIEFYRDGPFEDEEWFTRFSDWGSPPAVSVIANISGRHDGWPEPQAFVTCVLGKFNGVATDDGWLRCWSGFEVQADSRVDGRPFGYWRQ